jgi:hypothetical protein
MKAKEYKKWKRNYIIQHFLELPATLYQVFIKIPNEDGLEYKEILCIENILRNALGREQSVKVFIVESYRGKDARRMKKKIAGRYREIVEGTEVPPHVHICAIGNEHKSARNYVHIIASRLKNAGFKCRIRSIANNRHAINHINYCYRQSSTFHQYGNKKFNFRKYIIDDCEII